MRQYLTSWNIWRCREALTLREASALVAGIDPSELKYCTDRERLQLYEATLTLLLEAVEQGSLNSNTRPHECQPSQKSELPADVFDYVEPEFATDDYIQASLTYFWVPCSCKTESSVRVSDLNSFLSSKGLPTALLNDEWLATENPVGGASALDYFLSSKELPAAVLNDEWLATENPIGGTSAIPEKAEKLLVPAYLNSENAHYAPKLAAAVRAWQAVTRDEQWLRARSPKNALINWLKANASELGSRNPTKTLSGKAINEIAKIANWQLEGGAPKTPGQIKD
jgi:hypothetical protein